MFVEARVRVIDIGGPAAVTFGFHPSRPGEPFVGIALAAGRAGLVLDGDNADEFGFDRDHSIPLDVDDWHTWRVEFDADAGDGGEVRYLLDGERLWTAARGLLPHDPFLEKTQIAFGPLSATGVSTTQWDHVRWGCLRAGRCSESARAPTCWGEGDPDECREGGLDACPGQLLVPIVHADGPDELFVVDGKGRWARSLTSGGCYAADWTPEGHAAYVNLCSDNAILRRTGGWAPVPAQDALNVALRGMSVSADGASVWITNEQGGCCDDTISEVVIATRERRGGFQGRDPDVHPVDGRVLYSDDRPDLEANLHVRDGQGRFHLVSTPLDGKGYEPATPTWAPSGEWCAAKTWPVRAPLPLSTRRFPVGDGDEPVVVCTDCAPATYGANDDVLYVAAAPDPQAELTVYDRDNQVVATIPLPGIPDTARISWHLTGMGPPPPE